MQRRGADFIQLPHAIYAEPELAFAERRSCSKIYPLVAAERGFAIATPVAGLDTAFRADFGSRLPAVGVCAEYGALPEIGHACGHTIIVASVVSAAMALVEVADDSGLTLDLPGISAEEAGQW